MVGAAFVASGIWVTSGSSRPTLTRISKVGNSYYAVAREGVLRTATASAHEPTSVRDLAVAGLRATDDVNHPIAWTVSPEAIHYNWIYWDERGEVKANVFVKRLDSLKPAIDPLEPSPTWPTRDSMMPINRMRLYWKIAKRYPETEVGVDFVVDDGAVYTFVARIKDVNVMNRDCVTTWTVDMRDVEPAQRITDRDNAFKHQLPLPIHLVKAVGGKYVIDGALSVHQLGENDLTLVGSLNPAKDESADIILVRNDEAGSTTVLERVGDALLAVEFKPEKEGIANPFGQAVTQSESAAILALLQ